MEIKDTLNLPRTDFPMRARLPEREPEILARWRRDGLYGRLREARRGQRIFLLHDGPPYANGHIHLGTALNKILKDLVVRTRSMAGNDVPYVPGWDCHGMPIEHHVTRQMRDDKDPGLDDVVEVRRRCAEYATRFLDIQREEFQRLGGIADWGDPYLTMRPDYEVAILSTFRDLVEGGYVYKGLRSIHWCATCRTALAEAEVEYADHTSPWIYVRFGLVDDDASRRLLDEHLPERASASDIGAVIWTTTPWTIPANLAIAAHPDLEYLLVEVGRDDDPAAGSSERLAGSASDRAGDEQAPGRRRPSHDFLILAAGLAEPALEEMGVPGGRWRELARFPGRELEGLAYRHPLFDRTSPMILAEHVTLEQGTGLVHTAPGHGHEDFEIGRAYGLDVLCPVDEAGVFEADAGPFAGTGVFDANPAIVEALRQPVDGHVPLVADGTLRHSYPHCWRCKSPLIYRATEQWFLEIDAHELRRRLLEEIRDKVDWVPDWGGERIAGMVEARPDWCLSRQRAWGVPIPAVYCDGCRTPKVDLAVIDRAIEVVAEAGSDAWFTRPVSDFVPEGTRCEECGGEAFEKENDIFDVWFESGVSHRAVLESGAFDDLSWPADLYLEGHDQHRGWFQVSLITAVATRQAAPYRSVLTHGFVVDDKGHKMSKSLGNVVEPQAIWEKYGADILRLYFASVDYTRDTPVSEKLLLPVVESYRKIRNTLRFLLGNLADFDPEDPEHLLPPERWAPVDRWAMSRAAALGEQVAAAYDAYRFHAAVHRLHQFCVVTLSATYLDILKDRLYVSAPDDPGRRAAQTVCYRIADALTRWLAPVLAFTAEEVWQVLPGRDVDSVHLVTFPDLSGFDQQPREARELEHLMDLRGTVLAALERARELDLIGASLEAAVHLRPRDAEAAAVATAHRDDLEKLFIVSHAELLDAGAPWPDAGEVDWLDLWLGEVGEPLASDDGRWEVVVGRAPGDKCERCWTWKPTVGDSPEHPTMCDRCVAIVSSLSGAPRRLTSDA